MSVVSFIALSFREMFLVGFFDVALFVGCVVWLIRRFRNVLHGGSDAHDRLIECTHNGGKRSRHSSIMSAPLWPIRGRHQKSQ